MKIYKALTPSLRQLCLIDHALFSRKKKLFTFDEHFKYNAGRNHSGHITVRHRGGSLSKMYTHIDMFSRIFNVPFHIQSIKYDAYRSSFISLVRYSNGIYSYQLSIYKTFIGDLLMSYNNVPENLKNGDSCLIKYISSGSMICNIELVPNHGFQLSKSAGSSSLLLKKENSLAYIKLRSGKVIMISIYCMAFLGSISNKNYRYINLGKAGRSRLLGLRPKVRGVAMNPVDHPHGGGEGKKSKNSFPRSPWGKIKRNKNPILLFK